MFSSNVTDCNRLSCVATSRVTRCSSTLRSKRWMNSQHRGIDNRRKSTKLTARPSATPPHSVSLRLGSRNPPQPPACSQRGGEAILRLSIYQDARTRRSSAARRGLLHFPSLAGGEIKEKQVIHIVPDVCQFT